MCVVQQVAQTQKVAAEETKKPEETFVLFVQNKTNVHD